MTDFDTPIACGTCECRPAVSKTGECVYCFVRRSRREDQATENFLAGFAFAAMVFLLAAAFLTQTWR